MPAPCSLWGREGHVCVCNWTVNVNFNLKSSCKMEDNAIGTLFSVSNETTSIYQCVFSFLGQILTGDLRAGHLWDLSSRLLPFHTTWSPCPVKVLQSLILSMRGMLLFLKVPGRPPLAGQPSQSWGSCCSAGPLQVSWSGPCSTVRHLCSWHYRVILHHFRSSNLFS